MQFKHMLYSVTLYSININISTCDDCHRKMTFYFGEIYIIPCFQQFIEARAAN